MGATVVDDDSLPNGTRTATPSELWNKYTNYVTTASGRREAVDNVAAFMKKYFCEGQLLAKKPDPNAPWYIRYRIRIAQLIPILIVHSVWWAFMSENDWWYKFNERVGEHDKPRYLLTITMIFGSIVAGATSEGGGSIAFPVMTLALGIKPLVARDFSFMIQCVGMTSASFVIIRMGVVVDWRAIFYTFIGGVCGLIFGLEIVTRELEPAYSKMYFVVIWLSFAFSLFLLNRNHGRKVYPQIPDWEGGVFYRHPTYQWFNLNWKACLIVAIGFLGGIFSSIGGSGLDICAFATLALVFRLSEKTATPTSVIMMAQNTVVGFLYRNYGQEGVPDASWDFFIVCAPIVCIGAPLGSVLGSYCHRLTLAWLIYLLDAIQFIGALYVVEPWYSVASGGKTRTPTDLCWTSFVLFVSGLVFFKIQDKFGVWLQDKVEKNLEAQKKNSEPVV